MEKFADWYFSLFDTEIHILGCTFSVYDIALLFVLLCLLTFLCIAYLLTGGDN